MLHRVSISHLSASSESDNERLARLHFHLKTGDYFPTLATILGFVEETLGNYTASTDALPPLEQELIRSVRKDLLHLHEYYHIEPKRRYV